MNRKDLLIILAFALLLLALTVPYIDTRWSDYVVSVPHHVTLIKWVELKLLPFMSLK